MASLKDFNRVELLYPSKYLRAAELRDRDVTVTIRDIDPRGELQMRNGKKEQKPVVKFAESEKLWVMNVTCARSIAKVHGNEITAWIGKRITLYPTMVACGGQQVEAIRVREKAPPAKSNGAKIEPVEEPAHDEETGEVQEDGLNASGPSNGAKYVYT